MSRDGNALWMALWIALQGVAAPLAAASPEPAVQTADPYAAAENWLCRPGRSDPCDADEASTEVLPDGRLIHKPWQPAADAPIDCFYVYPTVSVQLTGNSDRIPGPGEKRAAQVQFARFASVCKPYAPMYRQITLAGIASLVRGEAMPMDPALAYADVLAAWNHYLKFDNHGRGVVLIGHSQGSHILIQLIAEQIDGKPEQAHLVSALILGSNVEVPKGQDVGGSFQHVPLCRAATQTGCVISYVSFRASHPPPLDARFGRVANPRMESACTDPAALSGLPPDAYLPTHSNLLGDPENRLAWEKMADIIDTPFVELSNLIQTRCVHENGAVYLAVSTQSVADDLRPADIPGDLVIHGHLLEGWGLHLVDVNIAQGNLIDIVRRQGQAFLGHPAPKEHAKNRPS